MEVWYNTNSMLNILAWLDVCKKFRINADTSVSNHITIHQPNKNKMIFKEVASGMYMFSERNQYKKSVISYSFLKLVEGDRKE